MLKSKADIIGSVQREYAGVAQSERSNDSEEVRAVARAFGYTEAELESLPPQSNMGLSCGNPTAIAGLRPGEIVVDLGCGGGLDVILAARKVGPTGRVIGIDMTLEMIRRARAAAEKADLRNVQFHLAEIDRLPLPDASVDCIISNCVVNLAPDKPAVFREAMRVLKPGGRVAISDIALRGELPEEMQKSVRAYTGCISGALPIATYEKTLREAGFDAVVVADTGADLNVYTRAGGTGCCTTETESEACSTESSGAGSCCGPSSSEKLESAATLADFDLNQFAASVKIHAIKGQSTMNAPEKTDGDADSSCCDKTSCCR